MALLLRAEVAAKGQVQVLRMRRSLRCSSRPIRNPAGETSGALNPANVPCGGLLQIRLRGQLKCELARVFALTGRRRREISLTKLDWPECRRRVPVLADGLLMRALAEEERAESVEKGRGQARSPSPGPDQDQVLLVVRNYFSQL